MSLQFSDTSSPYKGIIQRIEMAVYGDNALGKISGNTELLGMWTTRINVAMDFVWDIIFDADGRWQADDTNHTKYPTYLVDLVASQRNYSFSTDEQSNLILAIHAVYAKPTSNDDFELLKPVNELVEYDFYDGDATEGRPYRYGKKADGIFLDPVPDTSVTNGLKIEFDREPSYFTTSDTTKKPGFAGLYHDYLVVRPAFEYALENNLSNVQGLQVRTVELEQKIREYYARREQDKRHVMTMKKINYV